MRAITKRAILSKLLGAKLLGAALLGAGLLATSLIAPPAHAQSPTIRLGIQPGLTYLPYAVIAQAKLIEAAARDAGLGEVNVVWRTFAGANVMNDALIADSVDVGITGIAGFLTLWSKTKGKFTRALFSYGHMPITLVSRNPAVKTLADFTDKDRIAVPAVKVSIQAMYLQMAAERTWGPEARHRLDPLTIGRGHPDAMAALLGGTEINAHFAPPPFNYIELRDPRVHRVTDTEELLGTPVSNGIAYTTDKFYNANPKLVAALYAALNEAMRIINTDPKRAAELYLAHGGEKLPIDDIVMMIRAPGTVWDLKPRGVLRIAEFMHRTNQIPTAPAAWKELFFDAAHPLAGD